MSEKGQNNSKSPAERAVKDASQKVLSSEKREDLWAIIIAGLILLLSVISPDAVYNFFKKSLFLF